MIICHVSDTHGSFPPLEGTFDVVVHSGDFMPNTFDDSARAQQYFQRSWVKRHAARIAEWAHGKPFLFCHGNHDYIDPCPILRDAGIDARLLTQQTVEFGGLRFRGFPFINPVGGWPYELDEPEMRAEVEALVGMTNVGEVDVWVCHAPPYGVLDAVRPGVHVGTVAMADALSYALYRFPRAYLCGHIHEANGYALVLGVKISNAATGQRLIEV